MSRPSKEIESLAREIAKGRPPIIFAHRRVPQSWKNRGILNAAYAHAARRRLVDHPEQFPNRIGRQQKRWLYRRGLLAPG